MIRRKESVVVARAAQLGHTETHLRMLLDEIEEEGQMTETPALVGGLLSAEVLDELRDQLAAAGLHGSSELLFRHIDAQAADLQNLKARILDLELDRDADTVSNAFRDVSRSLAQLVREVFSIQKERTK